MQQQPELRPEQAGAVQDVKSPDASLTKLANRAAALTFLAAFTIVAGLVALPEAFDNGHHPGLRILALGPILVAILVVLSVRRARARLRSEAGSAPKKAALEPGSERR